MPLLSMVEAICSALGDEMERDERVIVLGEDVGKSGGVFRATDGLQRRFGADRVVDTPTAEAVIVGASIGLATTGFVPVAELQFLGFGLQAFHQIGHQLARWRYRTNGRFHAQVTIRAPYGGGVRAPELHSDGFEAVFAQMPGLKVVAPSTAADAKGMLLSAIRDPDPVMFLEPLRGYRLVRDEVPDGDVTVDLGVARTARQGSDVTVIAWSAMVIVALEAAEAAAEEGIDVEVIDLRSLVPLDVSAIAESVGRTGRAVVVQEAPLTAGFASEVVAAIQEGAFLSLQAPIARVSGWDVPYPMPLVEDHYVPSVERVLAAIRRTDGVLRGAPVNHEFRLVDIGEGLTEAEIVSWLVAVGDHVVEDQPVVEIETDKAVVEMPAPVTGTVVTLGGEVGAVMSVGDVLLVVDDGTADGEETPPSTTTPSRRGSSRQRPHPRRRRRRQHLPPPPVARSPRRRLAPSPDSSESTSPRSPAADPAAGSSTPT